jgi:hypothetical protein
VPTEKEIAGLFESILRGNSAGFGIVKLQALDLNGFYSDPQIVPAMMKAEQAMTLLEYSVRLNRDGITRALWCAGADPCKTCNNDSSTTLSIDVRRHLLSLSPALATYIIKVYVNSHIRSRLSAETPTDHPQCDYCCEPLTDNKVLLRPCLHHVCSVCFWRRGVLNRTPFEDAVCPVGGCACELVSSVEEEGQGEGRECEEKRKKKEEEEEEERRMWGLLTPAAIAVASKALYNALPATLAHLLALDPRKKKYRDPHKGPFAALPSRTLAGQVIGNHAVQRSTTFLRAVCAGNARRAMKIIVKGCDVQCPDESGNSPLMLATWHGHIDTVQILLQAGADTSVANNAGDNVFAVAAAGGNKQLIALLTHYSGGGGGNNAGHSLPPLPPPPPPSSTHSNTNDDVSPSPLWRDDGTIIELVPPSHPHLEARGSYVLDNCFSDALLDSLIALFQYQLQPHVIHGVASSDTGQGNSSISEHSTGDDGDNGIIAETATAGAAGKKACSDRVYFSDLTGKHALRAVEQVLARYDPASFRKGKNADTSGTINDSRRLVRLCEQGRDVQASNDPSLLANYTYLHDSHTTATTTAATGTAITGEGSNDSFCSVLLPGLRFLHYTQDGGCSPPHTDLRKSSPAVRYYGTASGSSLNKEGEEDVEGREAETADTSSSSIIGGGSTQQRPEMLSVTSTHTFILYLTDCDEGGETALLKTIPTTVLPPSTDADADSDADADADADEQQEEEGKDNGKKEEEEKGIGSSSAGRSHKAKKRRARLRAEKERALAGATSAESTETGTEAAAAWGDTDGIDPNLVVSVKPRRGRLLLFPHAAPHEGCPVLLPAVTAATAGGQGALTTKLLLRGESW